MWGLVTAEDGVGLELELGSPMYTLSALLLLLFLRCDSFSVRRFCSSVRISGILFSVFFCICAKVYLSMPWMTKSLLLFSELVQAVGSLRVSICNPSRLNINLFYSCYAVVASCLNNHDTTATSLLHDVTAGYCYSLHVDS